MKTKRFAFKRPALWVLWSALWLCIAIGVAHSFAHPKTRIADVTVPFTPIVRSDIKAASDASTKPSALADSILSIVQSYYVDADRVESGKLLQLTVDALGSQDGVKATREGDGFWVSVKDQKRFFKVSADPDYEELLGVYTRLGQFLDSVDPGTQTPGEGGSESGIVRLLNTMLTSLDAHSSLLSADAYRELRQGTEGSFGGLGVLVGIRDQLLTVIKPLPRSPALYSGIKRHDRILSINGTRTFGQSLDQLVDYMRGDPGTKVDLELLRDGELSPVHVSLKREVISVDSVTVERLHNDGLNILHLTIDSFSSRTGKEVLMALKEGRAASRKGIQGVILDLRSNPGGLLDQAVQVADLFLRSGVIVTTKGRREEVEAADHEFGELDFPMVVLINGDSASASEIVAGALQDQGRAVVVGQPSFGKGSVQTIFELPMERALKLTIARYYTPLGRSIQNYGITPDVWLHPVYELPTNEDLLGLYRYHDEAFLHHHLRRPKEDGLTVPPYPVAINGYYLTKPAQGQTAGEEDGFDRDEISGPDREMDVALQMIRKVVKTYGPHLPEGARRASHWLALAAPEVNTYVNALDRAVDEYLMTKFNIDWRDTHPDTSAITARIGSTYTGTAIAGRELQIPWRLGNDSDKAQGRLSVFLQSDDGLFETEEALVGLIPAHGEKRGSFTVHVPGSVQPGTSKFHIGIAIEGEPQASPLQYGQVAIGSRLAPTLSAKVQLLDEKGAKQPGVLIPREQARLQVTVVNDSKVEAHNVSVQILNLAGRQVNVDSGRLLIADIKPGEHKQVTVGIAAGNLLVTNGLPLGLAIDSDDLVWPVRQNFMVQSEPAQGMQRVSGLQAH